jgi:hypothetical protein
MPSGFDNEHQTDWDIHLPYIMMAYMYLISVHETTGMTLTMLMFGQEVSTPLELAYEMPSSIKAISSYK